MSTILGPDYQWHIIDLPASDPQEPENRALVRLDGCDSGGVREDALGAVLTYVSVRTIAPGPCEGKHCTTTDAHAGMVAAVTPEELLDWAIFEYQWALIVKQLREDDELEILAW